MTDNGTQPWASCPAITTAAGVLDRHAECVLPAGHPGPHRDSRHPQAHGPVEWETPTDNDIQPDAMLPGSDSPAARADNIADWLLDVPIVPGEIVGHIAGAQRFDGSWVHLMMTGVEPGITTFDEARRIVDGDGRAHHSGEVLTVCRTARMPNGGQRHAAMLAGEDRCTATTTIADDFSSGSLRGRAIWCELPAGHVGHHHAEIPQDDAAPCRLAWADLETGDPLDAFEAAIDAVKRAADRADAGELGLVQAGLAQLRGGVAALLREREALTELARDTAIGQKLADLIADEKFDTPGEIPYERLGQLARQAVDAGAQTEAS